MRRSPIFLRWTHQTLHHRQKRRTRNPLRTVRSTHQFTLYTIQYPLHLFVTTRQLQLHYTRTRHTQSYLFYASSVLQTLHSHLSQSTLSTDSLRFRNSPFKQTSILHIPHSRSYYPESDSFTLFSSRPRRLFLSVLVHPWVGVANRNGTRR